MSSHSDAVLSLLEGKSLKVSFALVCPLTHVNTYLILEVKLDICVSMLKLL